MIETEWDSNYWFTAINGVTMWTSFYNPLTSNYSQDLSFIFATETTEITITLGEIEEILNLSGRYLREDSLGPKITTRSNKNYKSKKSFIFLKEMIGDTVTIFIKTNYANLQEIEETIKVILNE